MTETAQVRPLHAILAAFEEGATSVADLVARTTLDEQTVRAGLDHLVRMGRVDARTLAAGCPSGGCGSCASGTRDGEPGCGASAPSLTRQGPVLVTLSLRRPADG